MLRAKYPVQWALKEGGLKLYYFAGKNLLHLYVDESYRTGCTRSWELLPPPQSTGKPPAVTPEELLKQATIPDGSDVIGLARFYPDATPMQQTQIVGYVEDECGGDSQSNACMLLRSLVERGEMPWLELAPGDAPGDSSDDE
jgi:hypothetical protein